MPTRRRPGFEWDEDKAYQNVRKHGVSFEEAISVLHDPFSVTLQDPRHSVTEHRYVSLGLSEEGRTLVVVYTERGGRIRVISCRPATSSERKRYETHRS